MRGMATGPLTRSSVPTVPNFSDDAAMTSNRWSLLLSIRDIALLSQWQVSQRCPFGADDRGRKDTVSKKIGQSRAGALLLHLCGLYTANWLGRGAPYCHDRLLVQHLERPGHPRNCERSFIRSASCSRDLQPSWLPRRMWAVRPDDQDNHQRSCGNNFACAGVGGVLRTPAQAPRDSQHPADASLP
jgi:hypothetical protein